MSDLDGTDPAGNDGPAARPPAQGPAPGGTLTAPAPGAARPAVSVIVCACGEDRWEDLSEVIRSLHRQTEAPREIILVMDHRPGLLRRAQREFGGVTVVASRSSQGLSAARNTGIAHAHGDVLAFTDHDSVPGPGWIAALAGRYADTRVMGVGGRVEPSWEDGRPGWYPPELDWAVGCSYQGLPASGPVRNLIGASMSFRREVFETAGGFSTAPARVGPRSCGEETEFCLRASQRNPDGILLYEPAAAVSHRVRPERATWRYLASRCLAEGVSKARIAGLAGQRRALASERRYVRSAVPKGIGRCLGGAVHGRLSGLLSALALAAAVLLAAAGYLAGRAATRAGARALILWGTLAAGLGLWAAALNGTQAAGVARSGLGLVTVLPATFWVAVAVLLGGFCWAVTRRGARWPALAAPVLALTVMLGATPAILYGTLRYSWAWKHVGVIDYITHHGIHFSLGGLLGVYQGWPGFFAANSFLTAGAGQHSALSYASWAVPVNDLLWLAPVLLIARVFSRDPRFIWTAGLLFELGNWVGQDYFSPQALCFFLYLTVIAVCLHWLARPAPAGAGAVSQSSRSRPAAGELTPAGRLALVACLLPLMAAVASSHQLTPFMLVAALAVLAVFRQLRPWWLPAVMAAMTAGWIAYAGLPWLVANSSQVFEGFGLPWANAADHLVTAGPVPSAQVIIDWSVRGLGVLVCVLAVTGYFRYRRHHHAGDRRSWYRIPLLAGAAIPSVAANSYGGEIIFRAFLFALPFLAVAAAAAFFPGPGSARPRLTGLALAVASAALAVGYFLGNYGNEAINYFTPREVAASQWLYRTAPRGAGLVSATSNYPWAFVHYDWYGYSFLDSASLTRALQRHPVATIARLLRPGHSPASYLLLTRSQAAEIRQSGGWPAGLYARISSRVTASARFRIVYRNPDAVILQLASPAGAARTGAAR